MQIALAQINTRVGDFEGNRARVRAASEAAAVAGADLVVFPELSVTGYPPRDLLLDPSFVDASLASAEQLARDLRNGPPVVVGLPVRSDRSVPGHPGLYNTAALLSCGRVEATRAKRLLPSYDVFNECRWFVPGEASDTIDVGRRVGLLVCEDMWDAGYPVHPGEELVASGAEVLVCISASPYRPGTLATRIAHATRHGVPFVFVNAVGATDELVFDGRSFVIDGHGNVVAALPAFDEAVVLVDVDRAEPVDVPDWPLEREIFSALVLGVRDFARKNGLRNAVLGLSGGVDSALVACIAAEALGPANVTAVAMPSRYSDPRSSESARALSEALGVSFEVVPIERLHTASEETLAGLLQGARGALAAENLQARLRMTILTTFVNSRGGVLLNTSNKTELSLGYGTLYGDMAGTLMVIGDLTKPQVYALARWYDREKGCIPRFVLDRPPSAELRPEQVDPFNYPVIAPVVEALVKGEDLPVDAVDVTTVRRSLRGAEHKRWQAGVVLKVSDKAFGTGRMIPVTHVWSGGPSRAR